MNSTYRLVWNTTLGLWQAAPETAKGRGKSKSSRALRPLHALAALTALAALAGTAAHSAPLPTNGSIVAGEGSIRQSGDVMTIDQASGKMAIDWQSFSIGQGNTVIFHQPSTTSVALNRVLGTDASTIGGALRANGHVFLLNPNGVLFSPTAQVNVGGLLASTLDMKLDDFLSSRYLLEGGSANAVVNQGALRAAEGGMVALVAARVSNAGNIDAPGGNVALGAASQVLVDLGGPVKLQLQQSTVDTLVENGGAIRADGGTVLLTAKTASTLSASAINQDGTISAQTLATGAKGEILLLGDMAQGQLNVGGTLDASAPAGGDGGFIETSAAYMNTANGLRVSAGAADGRGGQWLVDPFDYVINAAAAQTITASLNTGTSVTISTQASNPLFGAGAAGSGDITVNSAINKTLGGDATLTLLADRNVIVGADIGSTSGKLGITLSAGNGAGSHGGVRVSGNLLSNGGDVLVGGARGTPNQGIGFAANLSADEAAVLIKRDKSILSSGGNITVNGRSTVGANNGSYSGVTAGVYIESGARILSGTGDLYITGESTAGLKTFGIAFEAASGTKTVIGSATNGGNMLMNAVNSTPGTAVERDKGAMGMVNYGSVDRLAFHGPSVASWLVFINGVPQLSGYTRTPQLNCVAGYLNCGYLVVPGGNNSYLYAGYEAVSMETKAAYVIQGGAGTKVYDGSTLATNVSLSALGGPTGFTPNSLQPKPLFHTASKNVGTYTRLMRDAANPTTLVAGADTYAVGYFNTGSYAITPRSLTPVVTSKVYDGTSTAAVSATGVIGSDNVRLQGNGSFGGTNVGDYTNVSASGISLSGTDAPNYTLGSTAVSGMRASILAREVTLTAHKTYDGSGDLAGAVVIGNLVAGEDLGYSSASANSLHVDGATYVQALTLTDGLAGAAANYVLPALAAPSTANRAMISPRLLEVVPGATPATKTYDGGTAAPAGFTPTWSISGQATPDLAAEVAIGIGDIAYNSANVLDANRVTVSGMTITGISGGVANASDYQLAAGSRDIDATISARPLAIAADAASKVYGEADPLLGYRVTTGSLVGSDSLSGELARDAGENAGDYLIDASSLRNPNYAVTATNAALTIAPRAITVAADELSKLYGDADPVFGYRLVSGALVGSDTLSGALLRVAGEDAGNYAIDAGTLANGNYVLTVTSGSLTIMQRPITVDADTLAKEAGAADPALTWRLSAGNLVGSDALTGALARAPGEDVGSYAIGQGTLGNNNYAIVFKDATLDINAPPVVEQPVTPVPPPFVTPPVTPVPPPMVEQPVTPEPPPVVEQPVAPVTPPMVEQPVTPVTPPVVEQPVTPVPPPVVEQPVTPVPPPVVTLPVTPVPPPEVTQPVTPVPPPVVTPPVTPVPPPVVTPPVTPVSPPVVTPPVTPVPPVVTPPVTPVPPVVTPPVTPVSPPVVTPPVTPVAPPVVTPPVTPVPPVVTPPVTPVPPPVVTPPVVPVPPPVVTPPVTPVPPPVVTQPVTPVAPPVVTRPVTPVVPPVVTQPVPTVPAPALVPPVVPVAAQPASPVPVATPPVVPAPPAFVAEQLAAVPPTPAVAQQPVAAPAARPPMSATVYTAIVPELVPPTVGALSYVNVAAPQGADSGDAGANENEATALERAASHAPTSSRDVKFLDVMVVGGGINIGTNANDAPATATAAPGN